MSEGQQTEPLPPSTTGAPTGPDPALQHGMNGPPAPAPLLSFEGVPNLQDVIPPDTNGEVGPNHYVQWVNLSLQIFDKTGRTLLGPVPGNVLWEGFGGLCEAWNHGDPIVVYDQLADRWVLTQISSSDSQCVAVSQTPDPTGSYYRYEFPTPGWGPSGTKLALWAGGYSLTALVNASDIFYGVLERDKMLVGDPEARIVGVQRNNFRLFWPLPVDIDGPVAPPPGTPFLFVHLVDGSWGKAAPDDHDALVLEELTVDWSSDESPALRETTRIDLESIGLGFDTDMCSYSVWCIPQRGTPSRLPALSHALGWRPKLSLRGGPTTLVLSHTVDVDGSDHAGVRWYELLEQGDTWIVSQAGTYAPDADHRWTADLAMDRDGNLLVGYNVSGPNTYPGIRVAGRLATDPPGVLSQAEREVVDGQGFQEAAESRWGDYSAMSVDPIDGCTFWYTQEYLVGTGFGPWRTRVASFRFPTCGVARRGTIAGRVTSAGTGLPISGAVIDLGGGLGTVTDEMGEFAILAPEGSYEVGAHARGFLPSRRNGVRATYGGRTTVDIELQPTAPARLSGRVVDGGHGWGLYGKVTVGEHLAGADTATTVFTDPRDGSFVVELPPGVTYDLDATALVRGFTSARVSVELGPEGAAPVLVLQPDPSCRAGGYAPGSLLINRTSDASVPPSRWTVTDLIGDGGVGQGSAENLTATVGGLGPAASIEHGSRDEETVWATTAETLRETSRSYQESVQLLGVCSPLVGAAVAGLVINARCHEGVAGATVRARSGASTQSVATPEDVRLPAGFWWMFLELPSGSSRTETLDITAPGFATATASIDLVPGSVRWVEVELHGDVPCSSPRQPAGRPRSALGGPPR